MPRDRKRTGNSPSQPDAQAGHGTQQPAQVVARRATEGVQRIAHGALEPAPVHPVIGLPGADGRRNGLAPTPPGVLPRVQALELAAVHDVLVGVVGGHASESGQRPGPPPAASRVVRNRSNGGRAGPATRPPQRPPHRQPARRGVAAVNATHRIGTRAQRQNTAPGFQRSHARHVGREHLQRAGAGRHGTAGFGGRNHARNRSQPQCRRARRPPRGCRATAPAWRWLRQRRQPVASSASCPRR